MMLGAHMSIAGGVDKAIERGASLSCTAIQIFTKNSNQWDGRPITEDEVVRFKTLLRKSSIKQIIAHDSYLINLASGSSELRERSVNALISEVDRCRTLEIPYVVIHPGAHTGVGEDEGIKNIIHSLDIICAKTDGWGVDIALETTAGQGTNIGYRFEHLSRIITGVKYNNRIKTCIDTCHIFAAGYDIRTPEGYEKVIDEFNKLVGLDRLACIHLNDSKKGLESRVDRHEHIGKGFIGKESFRTIINDRRFNDIAMIIETPKGQDMKEDKINLRCLRRMIVL
ncbi:MAG: deoxyribonuclease IV [Thermodesulfovibrio sp. RBG_19FT_COMBO_42_12]|nr:MAG: deoxyribonuclease IV [Thermodesulfovibrio sp. RBG_19FT_COMBO_42_12]HZX47986.1 deoxyribonuclease IV [Nitrospirota bacterium]